MTNAEPKKSPGICLGFFVVIETNEPSLDPNNSQ